MLLLYYNKFIKYYGLNTQYCGLVGSAPAWNGTGCEFDSWQCRIYIPNYPMFIEPTITRVPSGFSGYVWLDTKIAFLKKILGTVDVANMVVNFHPVPI